MCVLNTLSLLLLSLPVSMSRISLFWLTLATVLKEHHQGLEKEVQSFSKPEKSPTNF